MSPTLAKRLLAILTYSTLSGIVLAGVDESVSPQVRQQLQQPLHATWEGQELGIVLDRISAAQGVSFWLDRRVDPQQLVSLRVRGEPVTVGLEQITHAHELGIVGIENILYVAPAHSAIELATLHRQVLAQVEQTAAPIQRRWLTPAPLHWPRLSEPRELLQGWLRQAGISLENEILIPHDLWAANDLPPTSLAARTTLLLAGFDLTCELSADGRTCTVVPIARPLVVEQRYGNLGDSLADVQQNFPHARITRDGTSYTVTGTSEVHTALRRLVKMGEERETPRGAARLDPRQRFTLKVENQPVGRVIAHLANQLGLAVEWDADLLQARGDVGDQLTSCEVTEVELEVLLECLLSPVGLTFRLEGNHLSIGDAPQ